MNSHPVLKTKNPKTYRRQRKYKFMQPVLRMLSDEDSVLRRLISSFVLFMYSLIGTAIYWFIANNSMGCKIDVWASMYYVYSILLSVGYGTILPCSTSAKIFTILYAIIGLPLATATVADIGAILERWTGMGWLRLYRLYRRIRRLLKKRERRAERESTQVAFKRVKTKAFISAQASIAIRKYALKVRARIANKNHKHLPMTLALALTILFISIGAGLFCIIESDGGENWSYFTSFYYVFTSVSLIGLGDLDAIDMNISRNQSFCDICQSDIQINIDLGLFRVIGNMVIIVIGVSMFTMCITIIQQRMQNVTEIVGPAILVEYVNALKRSHVTLDIGEDENEAEKTEKRVIRSLIVKRAGHLRLFIGKSLEKLMLQEYRRLVCVRLASTDTSDLVSLEEFGVMTKPDTADIGTQTEWTDEKKRRTKRLKHRIHASLSSGSSGSAKNQSPVTIEL